MPKVSFRTLNETRSLLFWGLVAVSVLLLPKLLNPAPDVPQLTVAQAKALIDADAMVLDVRGAEAFGNRHIPGAINLPLAVLQTGLPAILSQARDRSIVVYCNDGVRTGPEATQILNRAGFAKASNVQSGIEGWVAAGHPVTR
jgi:rhodanese-related sulfurtransferase